MFLAGLHALGRDGPQPLGEVDLIPPGADHLAGARRGQDREFERAGADALLLPQLGHERGDLGIGQRRMVLDPPHLRSRRQQVFEMAAPPRRVLALPVAARGRPIENHFDPAAHPARGFGLLGPDRLERLQHQPDIDRLNGQAAEVRIDVGFERRRPLRGVFRIAPAGSVRLDVGFGACSECHPLGRVDAAAERFAWRASIGSTPSATSLRASSAFWRASARE